MKKAIIQHKIVLFFCYISLYNPADQYNTLPVIGQEVYTAYIFYKPREIGNTL